MNKDLITRQEVQRLKNIGNKVAIYRQCANLSVDIFASRCHITVQELEAIEKGIDKNLNTAKTLRMAQELGVSYADLFEADDEKYYTNFSDDVAMNYIIKRCREYRFSNIAKTLDIPKSSVANWRMRKFIPSPFVLSNIFALLKITPVDLEGLYPAEQKEEEKVTVENVDMMTQVIDACNLYKNIEVMRSELDEIIEKAQKLRAMLGGQ